MGNNYIQGFMEVENDLDTLLMIHLTGNHYPPVSADFIPVCKEAIKHCNSIRSKYTKIITMPNGIKKTAWEIVDGLHLECFIDCDE